MSLAFSVGIGTSSPDHQLVVGTAGGGRWLVVNDTPDARWGFATGGYDLSIQNDSDGTPDGSGGGVWTTRLRITETGDLDVSGEILSDSLQGGYGGFVYHRTHCTIPDAATWLHIRTSIPTSSWGNVIMRISGFHGYNGGLSEDIEATIPFRGDGVAFNPAWVNQTTGTGSSTAVFYETVAAFNGDTRLALAVPALACCCAGQIRIEAWTTIAGWTRDAAGWAQVGTFSSSPAW